MVAGPRRGAAARRRRSWSTAASSGSSAGAATAWSRPRGRSTRSRRPTPAGACSRRSSAASLWAVQTPQVVPAPRRCARALAGGDLERAYDDAQLVEAAGGDVRIVEAPRQNLKVTTAHDLRIAELLLASAARRSVMLDRLPHAPAPGRRRTRPPERYFTEAQRARATSRCAAERGDRRARLLRARATASARRSTSGAIRSGRSTPSTTWTTTSSSCWR